MKKILCLLIMSVMVLSVGMVSADVDFIVPAEGSYANANILISWENGDYATSNLMYKLGICDGSKPGTMILSNIVSVGNKTWDISSLNDGIYCIKIADGTTLHNETSITIDKTAPNVTFSSASYSVVKGNSLSISADIVDGINLSKYVIKFNSTDTGTEFSLASNPETISKSYTYTASGEYVVTIIAYDKAGNTKTATVNVIVSDTAPDWIISLSAASANLISIPYVPENTDYKEVLDGVRDNLDRVWSYEYDSSSKVNVWKYRQTTATGWSTTGSLSEIVPGRAYYVFMDADDVLYGNKKTSSGSSGSAPVSPPSVKLANGYNLIGMFGEPTVKTVTSVLSSLKSLDEINLYWYKVLEKNGNEVPSNADLTVGKSYWISMKHMPDTATEDYYTYYP